MTPLERPLAFVLVAMGTIVPASYTPVATLGVAWTEVPTRASMLSATAMKIAAETLPITITIFESAARCDAITSSPGEVGCEPSSSAVRLFPAPTT